MKVTLVGAGAVGGYFGGRMAQAGLDVTFLVRQGRAEQLRRSGLVIRGTNGDADLAGIRTETDVSQVNACDIVILAVKNYHLTDVLGAVKELVKKGAFVLPLLNGIEHMELLAREVGAERVLGGLCQIIVSLNEHGHVIQLGGLHDLVFGPLLPEQRDVCARFEEALAGANMNAIRRDDIWRRMWQKYAFITAFSGVTTASRLSIDRIMANAAAQDVFRSALSDMQTLAASQEADLPERFVEGTLERMRKMLPGSTSSMHNDLQKGLPLEVESLQGGALRLAAKSGFELPTVRTLYGLLKPYEFGGGDEGR